MNGRTALLATAELLGWWAALAVLWLVFISTVDTLELVAARPPPASAPSPPGPPDGR